MNWNCCVRSVFFCIILVAQLFHPTGEIHATNICRTRPCHLTPWSEVSGLYNRFVVLTRYSEKGEFETIKEYHERTAKGVNEIFSENIYDFGKWPNDG